MITTLEIIFWASVGAVILVTLGYPVFLVCATAVRRLPRIVDEEAEPTVTLVIAAYNEESSIGPKIENSLELDYPREKLEIVVASDGSTDRTNEIVESYRDRGVHLAAFPRTGKTGVQNRMALRARGEILVFSDANAFYEPDAIRKLVRNFADPQVAGVCGQLVYRRTAEAAGSSERAYWDYEKFMKLRESWLSSVVGANGSIYAVRRADYVQLDEGLISDLVEPLALVRAGKRVVYEPEAISVEEPSASFDMEFRRKVRILTRSIVGLLSMRALFNPFRYGVFSLQLFMHKFMRFITPLFLLLAAGSLLWMGVMGRLRPLAVACVVAVGLALVLGRASRSHTTGPLLRVLQLVYYYLMVNTALVLAWLNVLRGNRMKLWQPERKRA